MRYVMRIFDTPLLEFEASYGEGLQAGGEGTHDFPMPSIPTR